MISKALLQAFKKLRPDLLEVEFTEQMCITVLEQIEKRQENDKGKMTDKEMRLTVRVNLLQEELRLALLAGRCRPACAPSESLSSHTSHMQTHPALSCTSR